MNEKGIKVHYIKPLIVITCDSDFSVNLKNVLKRNFYPTKPNTTLCFDNIYIWTQTDFVYFTSIMS